MYAYRSKQLDHLSAAGELGVDKNATTIQGICVLTNVGLLIIKLSLPETLDEFRFVRDNIHSVGRSVEVVTKVRVLVLLSVPDAGALLGGNFENMCRQLFQGRIVCLSHSFQTILRKLSKFLSYDV